MSQFTDIRDQILGLVGLARDPAPTVTASASTDVEVNPSISSINYIDTSPIAEAINDLGVKISGQGHDGLGPVAADRRDLREPPVAAPIDLRLVASVAALGLALYRMQNS